MRPIALTAFTRSLDLIGATVALVLLFPLFLVIAVAIKITSTGPILVRQQRDIKGRKSVTTYKFRTRRWPISHLELAPQITTVGQFLRKLRLDELPYLINVLSGDMSLIDLRTHETFGSGQTGDLPLESHPRRVLEGLQAAAYVTDANGNVTCYNAAAVELWGRRPRLCQDRWCGSWRLYWPDGSPLPLDQCPMATALKERWPVRGLEVIAERPDGTRVPFIAFPTLLYDASGKLSGGVNMLIDITHRTVAEEQMQELEAKLDTVCVVLASGGSASVRDAPGAQL